MAYDTSQQQSNPGLSEEVFGPNYDYTWRAEHGKEKPGLVVELGKRAVQAAKAAFSRLQAYRENKADKTHNGFDRVGLAEFKNVSARPDSNDPVTEVMPVIAEESGGMGEIMNTATDHAKALLGATAAANAIPMQREPQTEYTGRHASDNTATNDYTGKHQVHDTPTAVLPRIDADDNNRELVGSSKGQ